MSHAELLAHYQGQRAEIDATLADAPDDATRENIRRRLAIYGDLIAAEQAAIEAEAAPAS